MQTRRDQRSYPNENLANDFSVEATHDFSRDERRAHARGYGVDSAFEQGGGVQISHRGKGPKGFKRSDERIKELVSEALSDHHGIDASELEVNVKDGEVTLTGTVTERRLKRLAEEIVDSVSGVIDVHNTIRIASLAPRTSITDTATQRQNSGNIAPRSQH